MPPPSAEVAKEHAVLKEKQLQLLKEVDIAEHVVLIGTDDDI